MTCPELGVHFSGEKSELLGALNLFPFAKIRDVILKISHTKSERIPHDVSFRSLDSEGQGMEHGVCKEWHCIQHQLKIKK